MRRNVRKISVTGLGYAGLPVVVAFGLCGHVVGYDVDQCRLKELAAHYDRNGDIPTKTLKQADIKFTSNPNDLKAADFHIVVVPTPINAINDPDVSYLVSASRTVGSQLKKGDIVVFESTVYPGATEEVCVPALEKASKLKSGRDFFVGYSPERINPGDKKHTFSTIVKIVSGQDAKTLEIVADTYSRVVKAGVHRVSCIKAAEAAKIIENTQRDLNISLMNEFAFILHKMGINTLEVLKAAETKWNFIPMRPGFVGGHCIGVDPYYLTFKARELGYHPDVILSGRRVNDAMGKHIAERTIKYLLKSNINPVTAKIAVLGLSYKKNCPDLRNTRVMDLIRELQVYDMDVVVHDPVVDAKEVHDKWGFRLVDWEDIVGVRAIVVAVDHDQFRQITRDQFREKLSLPGLIIDIKGICNPVEFSSDDLTLWQL